MKGKLLKLFKDWGLEIGFAATAALVVLNWFPNWVHF